MLAGCHSHATGKGTEQGILMHTKAMAAGFTLPPQKRIDQPHQTAPNRAMPRIAPPRLAMPHPALSLAAKSIGTARTSPPASDGCTTLAEPVSTKPRPAAPCLTLPHQAAPYRASPHRAQPQRFYRRCAWNLPKRGRQSPRPTSAPAILNQPDTVAALTTESSY